MFKRKQKTITITKEQYERIKAHIKHIGDTYYWMKNAASEDNDGSMIKYWEEKTGIDLNSITYTCPHCKKPMRRDQLDGSHVVKCDQPNGRQFITPLCQSFNRSKDKDTTFFVPKHLVIPAP